MPITRPPLMFGVELEQLPEDCGPSEQECDECYGSGTQTVECEYGHEHEVNCDCCNGAGHWDGDGDGSAEIALDVMRRLGITTHRHIHCYHCDCSECAPFRSAPLLAAQSDCTVGIEWVSRAMRSPENLRRIIEGHEAVMSATGWTPNGYEPDGNHVHIGIPKDLRHTPLAHEAFGLVAALVIKSDWDTVANGGCHSGQVREYNNKGDMRQPLTGPPDPNRYVPSYNEETKGYTGSFLWRKNGGATFEYRMWNTPAEAWRIAAHAGLSMAITLWALYQAEETPGVVRLPDALAEFVQDITLGDIAERWLPLGWPFFNETIELASASS